MSTSAEAVATRLSSSAASPTAVRPFTLSFISTALQVGLLLLVIRVFEIEPGSGLPRVLPVIFGGFLIHSALPLKLRLPFFLALSLTAAGLILGPLPAAVLVIMALTLVGLCHLPAPFSTRIVLLLLAGAGLWAVRAEWISAPAGLEQALGVRGVTRVVIPVLGSMFMFRLIIYLYDLRHDERTRGKAGAAAAKLGPPASVWQRLSYFLLLPNICFLLFPVIDYRTFRRTYYDTDAQRIYQNGVWWIFLGVLYYLVYRFVYHYLVPTPEAVQGLGGVVRFMSASYLIYFRVVAQFHLIIGILCLFGFNLPPAHNYFLLASSFTDFWRRARIEWKDFMVKIFYYPAFVPLQRRFPPTAALVIATVAVFVVTWLLHSYQWFWIRGDFRLTRADGVFWVLIGGCVLVNSVLESKRKPQRGRGSGVNRFRSYLVRSLKMVGMFSFMCILWSYWSSPSYGIWRSYLTAAGESTLLSYVALAGFLLALVALGIIAQLVIPAATTKAGGTQHRAALIPDNWRPLTIAAAAVALLAVRVPATQPLIAQPLNGGLATLSSNELNEFDQEREDRGYYEVLMDEPRSTSEFINANPAAATDETGAASGESARETRSGKSESEAGDEPISAGGTEDVTDGIAGPRYSAGDDDLARTGRRRRQYERLTSNMLLWENTPSFAANFKGKEFRTNSWGMRDNEYPAEKPPNTFRIALLGSSMTAGAGVRFEKTLDPKLEDMLNREGPGAPTRRYEVLNFSVGGYGILQNVFVADQKVFQFSPNAVFIGVFSNESGRMVNYLMNLVKSGAHIPYAYMQHKLRATGARAGMEEPELRRRLAPVADDLVQWSYRYIAQRARENGATPIALVLPEPIPKAGHDIDQAVRLATASGLPLLDLRGVYGTERLKKFKLGGRDPHWNSRGHSLVANRIFNQLKHQDARLLKLGFK